MRVAFVSEVTAHCRDTDVSHRMRHLVDGLAGRGHDVRVFCGRWWEDEDEDELEREEDEVTYEAVAGEPGDEPSSRFALSLPTAVRQWDPDIIHAVYPPARHVLAAKTASLLTGAPLVVDWYGGNGLYEGMNARSSGGYGQQLAVRAPDEIVTPSDVVRTQVREAGADGSDVHVIPDGINVNAIQSVEASETADIVYSRPLDEHANVESLLLALAELRERDWRATIIGDGPERHVYERQVRDLRIDDRVSFAGDLPLEERVAAFKDAHVFVQTALRESFPTDLLRALACGCVGIVEYHARSGAHELVQHEERGFRTTNEQELADAIRTAGGIEPFTFNERFAEYDHGEIVDQYVDRYERLQ